MKLKWGIWGTGGICNEFAAAMPFVENGELAAVLSRSGEKARSFAQEYGIPSAYGDAQAFLADTDIDVVYIGTPNIAHYQNVMDCLEAGKHVLCEKPMAVNEKELDAIDRKSVV